MRVHYFFKIFTMKEKVEAAEKWISDHFDGSQIGGDKNLVLVNGVLGVVKMKLYLGPDAEVTVVPFKQSADLGSGPGVPIRLVF